jgi:acyl dehydratase
MERDPEAAKKGTIKTDLGVWTRFNWPCKHGTGTSTLGRPATSE